MMAGQELRPIADAMPPVERIEQPCYSGYPWWLGLVVEPNRETQSAERLNRVGVDVYLPRFSRVVCRRMGSSRRRFYAVIPALLFVPIEFMDIPRRDQVLEWAHVHSFIRGASSIGFTRISKADIERVRQMEAELNLPENETAASNGKALKPGVSVRFGKGVWAWLGDGIVIDVVSRSRIGVEVAQLFGARRKIYVPAREIEVM